MPRILNPVVGLLTQTTTPPDAHIWDAYIAAFKGALCTNGSLTWAPPQTGVDYNSYLAGAQTLMAAGADVIVTAGNVAAKACYAATNPAPPLLPIPNAPAIVVASAGDLTGLTGGNLTGCTNGQEDRHITNSRIAKMIQLLQPAAVGIVGNHSVSPVGKAMDYVLTQLGNGHQVDLNQTNVQNLQGMLNNLNQQYNVDVLYVCSDPFLRTNGNTLVQVAHGLNMTTMHEFGEWVTHHHGDRAYGPDFKSLFQRAAGYVDQILNGANPADRPVFAPQDPQDCVSTPSP